MNRFLTGALLGVVVGLLLAPQKGEDLREDLADAADKWNKLVGKADANLDDLKTFLDKNIDGLSDDLRHRISTILDEAEELAYNTKNQLSGGIA